MEGLVWLGVICIEVCGILEDCRFSLAHSGTITALNSSWTVTPLFFASEDISANGFSFILSMNLGTVKHFLLGQLGFSPYDTYITFYTPSEYPKTFLRQREGFRSRERLRALGCV